MPIEGEVSRHYTHGSLVEALKSGIASLGKTPATITIDDLAPIDEFHIGGREASEQFLDQLKLTAGMTVLDVGCGLGGPARVTASRYGSRVAGIDLTSEFVEAGNTLCRWVGVDRLVTLRQGSALELPFADQSFDAAYMLHVGMNIEDKEKLAAQVARVLRPGCLFGIYDVMRTGPGDLVFPLPWAERPDISAVAAPERYRSALKAAGFEVVSERNRREYALDFFAKLRARMAAAGGPPPLGLHVLMGEGRAEKMANMVENISKGRIAPVEMIARKV